MVQVLPALYGFSRPGQEVILLKVAGEVVGDGLTGVNVPFANTFRGVAVAVGAGDIMQRGNIQELVMQGVSDHAGTVHMVLHPLSGTGIVGTVTSVALTANAQLGTVFTVPGTAERFSFKFINAAGAAGTVSFEVRGRTRS